MEDLWKLDLTSKVWEQADPGSSQAKFEIWPDDQVAGAVWTGKELVVFGCSGKGGLDNTWAFNPAQKSWRKLPVPKDRPTHRVAAAFVAPNPTVIYMFGGLTGAEIGHSADDWFNELWRYDVAENAWSRAYVPGYAPEPRLTTSTFNKGWAYFHGGEGHGRRFFSDLWSLGIP